MSKWYGFYGRVSTIMCEMFFFFICSVIIDSYSLELVRKFNRLSSFIYLCHTIIHIRLVNIHSAYVNCASKSMICFFFHLDIIWFKWMANTGHSIRIINWIWHRFFFHWFFFLFFCYLDLFCVGEAYLTVHFLVRIKFIL